MRYAVGKKGQVVIAKDIRDRLGVGPGWMTIQRVVNGHLQIDFIPPEHNRSLRGALAKYAKRSIPTGRAWRRARERAWREAAREKMKEA